MDLQLEDEHRVTVSTFSTQRRHKRVIGSSIVVVLAKLNTVVLYSKCWKNQLIDQVTQLLSHTQ